MSKCSYSPEDMVNASPIPQDWLCSLVKGESEIFNYISQLIKFKRSTNNICKVAIEAHLGVNWHKFIPDLEMNLKEKGLKAIFFDISICLKDKRIIEKMIHPYLPNDPIFGRIYNGKLIDFFDKRKLFALRNKIKSLKTTPNNKALYDAVICYGSGATLFVGNGFKPFPTQNIFDYTFYIDIVREEILKRVKLGIVQPIGVQKSSHLKTKKKSNDALPAYFGTRRLYYIDYPVLDKHRKCLLKKIDYYIDGNALSEPKMLPANIFHKLMNLLASSPIKPKPYYDPSPWGGFWLKKIRKLSKEMVNCAWSYDLIEPETSFLVKCGKVKLEFPFSILVSEKPYEIMGKKGMKRKFRGQFPIRINYDDSYDGDDMALQDHPNDTYVKKHFNEPFRQDESYYIVDCKKDSKVYLGLRDDINLNKFKESVIRAEKEGVPFDHNQFVNSILSKTGDLFLIPAGTLHSSGKNETVLEISATTYRYTFHFYDYLRPGLDGKLRSIHSKHSFNALKTYRKAKWIEANLKQKPRPIRKGKNGSEYLIGLRRDMFFKVHRLEFNKSIDDDTRGDFHLLILVAGERIKIIPHKNPALQTELPFSCLILIPAGLGKYTIKGIGNKTFKVVKVLMK